MNNKQNMQTHRPVKNAKHQSQKDRETKRSITYTQQQPLISDNQLNHYLIS